MGCSIPQQFINRLRFKYLDANRSSNGNPEIGLHIILWHTLAKVERTAEVVLRTGISLLGGFAVPANSLGVVFLDALPVVINSSEAVFGERISLVGGLTIPVKRLC